MNKPRIFFQAVMTVLAMGLAAYSANLRAEDIDIYVDNGAASGVSPNVLFVIDNSSNLASTWNGGGCSAYGGTNEAPSLGTGTAGGVIQCALVDAINSLPDGTLNIGILAGTANGYASDVRATGDAAFHETCTGGTDGGCLLRKLTLMSSATGSKQSMTKFIKSWSKGASNSATVFDFTIPTAKSGQMMQEAWAYYNGQTGMSGKIYSPSLLQGCQKNFIIYIGNTDKTPNNEVDSFSGSVGLNSGSVGATADQKLKITEKAEFKPPICGNIKELVAGNSASDWSSNWADEWAQLMFQQDGGTSAMQGKQNIVTYGIGILNNEANQCTADYPALLSSMSKFGGGKYFSVSNVSEMTTALMAALNEVQAVNSVFSSASLPVSVNAEGSYLNQIFLGMFRPDSSGAPRWMGNLKQYQLIRNSTGQLVMGDAAGKAAISSGGTGFLAPDAVSFWTYKQDSELPDSGGGFFKNDKKGTPASGFDKADGEVVEKGGVAQQLRKQNLTATFEGASGTTANPRKVYTFCPQGTSDATACQPDLTHADNDFSTDNAKIAAATFGSAITVPVASIVRTRDTAVVTTVGNHGFTGTSQVTIRNAHQPEYNKTQLVEIINATQFRITGLPDYPTTPSTVAYTVSVPGAGGSYAIQSITRTTSNTGAASEKATVTTVGDHPYAPNQMVTIQGAGDFSGSWVVVETPASNQFTFWRPISPASPPVGVYQVSYPGRTVVIDSIVVSGGVYTVNTRQDHLFHDNQTVTISSTNYKGNIAAYNGSHLVTSVVGPRSFKIATPTGAPSKGAGTGNVSPSTEGINATIRRDGTTVSTTATVTVGAANWFANGDTVDIIRVGGSPEEGYAKTATITCEAPCTTFKYNIAVKPGVSVTGGTVTIPSAGNTVTVPAGNITRDGTVGRVTGVTPGLFAPGASVQISAAAGSAPNTETAYVNRWTIDCGADTTCASFTFGPVALTPATPATPQTGIQAYSSNTSPDKNMMIKWLRGHDNQGDEKGPGGTITVRPSMHGDVLHSRPLVINYGDARGIVVFYGSNDGVYRAVNGNQSAATNGVPAGGELWGLILPEHYQLINRYRSNSPELKFPSSTLPTAEPKDYFVDGPTGVYQKLNADNTIAKAIIYLTMRRGGRLIYALDVTQPHSPRYLWHIDHQKAGFEELGQTWSRPRLTLLQGYKTTDPDTNSPGPTPVLVFGAGYDPAQDAEPPGNDSMGRGLFIVNARTGDLVWTASKSCDATASTCKRVEGMKYATPSDVTFVDRDLNGYTDKIYWGDLGGNIWRADVADASVANWKITRVAQLGCDSGECASGTTPRKFFFPPAVLSVRPAAHVESYEALSIVSGDREHPLKSDAAQSSYNVQDKFFMIKDAGTTVGAPDAAPKTVDVTASDTDLFDATAALYDNTKKGFYIELQGDTASGLKGEKGVNAPIAVNGQIFFSTNRPVPRSNLCSPNLGEAKAYAISPFTGKTFTNVLDGGGLPPSAVAGLITITTSNADGTSTDIQEKFCIGCGVSGAQTGGTNKMPCTSALENCSQGTVIPKNLKRTYWYKK